LTGQANSLRLSVGSGTSFIHGGFYQNDPEFPSQTTTPAQATASLARVQRSGSSILFDTNGGNLYTAVDPTKYDRDGDGTLANVGNGNWSIQRVFSDPKTGVLYVYYGQARYTSLLNALQFLPTDPFTEGDTFDFTTFIGFLVLKGNASDITDTTYNSIINAGLFRGSGQGSGGGIALSNLDDLTDVSVTSPTNGQALIYDSGIWQNGTPLNATSASFAQTASVTPSGSSIIGGTGANGQVAFWNGTNSQTGDNGLFWDNTNKRLGVGTNSNLLYPLTIKNTSNAFAVFDVTNGGSNFGGFRFQINSFDRYTAAFNGNNANLIFSRFNSTGTYQGDNLTLFNGTGNVVITGTGQATDAGFRLDVNGTTRLNGNTSIGGGTAGARLDVRAQGALSTDIAFRVRNSADTLDTVQVRGDGVTNFNLATGQSVSFTHAGGTRLNLDGTSVAYRTGNRIILGGGSDFLDFSTVNSTRMTVNNLGNVGIGTTTPNAKLDVNGNTIITGSLQVSQSLFQYSNNAAITSGSTANIASFPTSSYTAGFFDYVATSGTNARAGTVFTVWNANNVEYVETSTNDIGNTSNLLLSASVSAGAIRLQGTSLSGSWSVKTLTRMI
jgi:hypothetical protein